MNRATRINVVTLSIILAISGINHGFFEILQGNTPTESLVIQAIGKSQQMWFYGSEEAFTIIPNFLVTGIVTIGVSTLIIIWSIGFVHKNRGPLVLFLLFILLFLVGGGIGQIIFFSVAVAVATRINKPLTWWRKVLPKRLRGILATFWPLFLVIGSLLFLLGLVIAITGYVPNTSDPEQIINIDWSILGLGLLGFLLAVVAGFAYDIERSSELYRLQFS